MKESVVFSFEESMTDVKGHVKFRDYLIEKISLLFFVDVDLPDVYLTQMILICLRPTVIISFKFIGRIYISRRNLLSFEDNFYTLEIISNDRHR